MRNGKLYNVGVGPGDPGLVTVRAAEVIGRCRCVFAPTATGQQASAALRIVERFITPGTRIEPLAFPMTDHRDELERSWDEAASRVIAAVAHGEDACYLTLGDPSLYSTSIYLLRALKRRQPELDVITVAGVCSFSAVAALAGFSLGEGATPVTIVPAAGNLDGVARALANGGTVVIMKIGRHLPAVLRLLHSVGLLGQAVFVADAGGPRQRLETDLSRLWQATGDSASASAAEAGYLSVILVHAPLRLQESQ